MHVHVTNRHACGVPGAAADGRHGAGAPPDQRPAGALQGSEAKKRDPDPKDTTPL